MSLTTAPSPLSAEPRPLPAPRLVAQTSPAKPPEISVVVPMFNEGGNVERIVEDVLTALDGEIDFELILVDDGSTDDTSSRARNQMHRGPIRLVSHSRRSGQSAAVRSGVKAARAAWIATIDGDGQNDPADLLTFWKLAAESTTAPALINGHRRERRDSAIKRVSSRIANAFRQRVLNDQCPDSGCGIRMFRRDVFLDLPWFDHVHRFLPAMVRIAGHTIESVPVNHRCRASGMSKYGTWDRLWAGVVDLLGVLWLRSRTPAAFTATEVMEGDRA